jgi:hypothetical protein
MQTPRVRRSLFDSELGGTILVLITFRKRRREVPEAGELDAMKNQASFPSQIDIGRDPSRWRRFKRCRRHRTLCVKTQSHGEGTRTAQPEIFHSARFMLGIALITFEAKEFPLVEPAKWDRALWVGAF